jgi:hypothetical protein
VIMNLLAMHRAESGHMPGFWPGSLGATSGRAPLAVMLCLGLVILALALVTGCAVGPDYKRPEATTVPDAYSVATVGTNYG